MGQLRAALIPPVGCRLVIVDYAQLEIVILAHLIAALFGPEDPRSRRFGERRTSTVRWPGGCSASWLATRWCPAPRCRTSRRWVCSRSSATWPSRVSTATTTASRTSRALPDGSVLGVARSQLLTQGLRDTYPGHQPVRPTGVAHLPIPGLRPPPYRAVRIHHSNQSSA